MTPLYQRVRWRFGGRSARLARKAWGKGPWQSEPDAAWWWCCGYRCCAARTEEIGVWCGYIDVPTGHPWHGQHMSELDALYVHRGVTFAADAGGVWRVGFDCAHYGDRMPGVEHLFKRRNIVRRLGGTYKPLSYVMQQCLLLAMQAECAAWQAAQPCEHYWIELRRDTGDAEHLPTITERCESCGYTQTRYALTLAELLLEPRDDQEPST